MSYMFNNCSSLTSLNVDSFNTINVQEMNNMFYGCSSLKYLDISSFNTNNCKKYDSIFEECYNLTLKIDQEKCANIYKILPEYIIISE